MFTPFPRKWDFRPTAARFWCPGLVAGGKRQGYRSFFPDRGRSR